MASILNGVSHMDHAMTAGAHLAVLSAIAEVEGFRILQLTVTEEQPCKLHGPIVGEPPVSATEAFSERRGARPWESRMCRRPDGMTHTVTVIVGPHEGATILYTAYPGPLAPREPGDPALTEPGVRAGSEAFWAEHALGL